MPLKINEPYDRPRNCWPSIEYWLKRLLGYAIDHETRINILEQNAFVLPYKVYTALIYQEQPKANPKVIVLENTLGQVPIFRYISDGVYDITTPNACFSTNRTHVTFGQGTSNATIVFVKAADMTTKIIPFVTMDATGHVADMLIDRIAVEIRVYN